jgi:hypothetical protein
MPMNVLERAAHVDARHAERQALSVGIVPVVAVETHLQHGGAPGGELDVAGLEALREILEVIEVADGPDAREVRVAVNGARHRRREIGFAIGEARDAGGRIVNPLRGCMTQGHE